MRRLGKSGESWTETAALPGAEKVPRQLGGTDGPTPWKELDCYGSPVQEDGDREALRPPVRLRGSVHTSARRRVTTALAIVSSVAWLRSVSTSREAEVDVQESDESRENERRK